MSNRNVVDAVLRVSSVLGSMAGLTTTERKLRDVERSTGRLNKAMAVYGRITSVVAPAAVAYGVARSVRDYAQVERRINRIAITAGEGRDAVSGMMSVIDATAQRYALSQEDVTAGLETLISSGLGARDAMNFLPSVAITAQAAGAEIADIASTAQAVSANFKIAAGEMGKAFDVLTEGGKAGLFELRDMAQYLPSLAPAFAAIGYKGTDGLAKLTAALQIIRQQTGTAGEAATNAQNVFTKMFAGETARSFKKMGVDYQGAMGKARKEGKDLLEVFLDLTKEATKGDMQKLPLLFTDAQFMQGVRALWQGREAMQALTEELKKADGVTMRDAQQAIDDTAGKIQKLDNAYSRLLTSIGKGAVSLGIADGMSLAGESVENLNEAIDRRTAARAALARRGNGLVRRNFTFDLSQAEIDGLAWEGGYRSKNDRIAIAGYGEYQKSRAAVGQGQDLPEIGPKGQKRQRLPRVNIPIPTARPDPSASPTADPAFQTEFKRQDLAYQSRVRRSPVYQPGRTPRDAEIASMDNYTRHKGGLRDAVDEVNGNLKPKPPTILEDRVTRFRPGLSSGADIVNGMDERLRAAVADGGTEAGRSIEDGGKSIMEAARAVNEAGDAFRSIMDSLGDSLNSKAAQAAQTFNSNIRIPTAPTSTGMPERNRGNSMVGAGTPRFGGPR